MRLLFIRLLVGVFVFKIFGKKIFIKRNIFSPLLLTALWIVIYYVLNIDRLFLISGLYILFLFLIYGSFYYLYTDKFYWHELDRSQRWYVGHVRIRKGQCKLISDIELKINFMEWDLLDRYYKS